MFARLAQVLLCVALGRLAAAAGLNASPVSMENDVLRFSYELEHLLDRSKQPCQDFYGYVCGHSSNANQTQSLREQHRKHEQQRFERFLAAANEEHLLDMELKLKSFYKSCETSRDLAALKGSLLYKSSGGWPALETTAAMQRVNLTALGLLGSFHEMGLPYFFETRITMRSNKRIVELQPDGTRRHTLRKFEQLMGEVLSGYAVERTRAPLVALEVLSFERSRRDIIKADVAGDPVEFSYSNFKKSALGNASVRWDSYFRKVLGKPLQPSDTIVVTNWPRLVAYFGLLRNTTLNRLLNWLWIDYLMDIAPLNCQQLAESLMGDVYMHVVQRASSDRAQMAQMYAAIGKSYKEQLAPTVWLDEMSQQSSQQFLGRVMHLTLNGDEKLDAAYGELAIGKRNFYRNLEKLQRFRGEQKRRQTQAANTGQLAVKEYMQVFGAVNMLLEAQTLSPPLNYWLVGEHFARSLLAAGSSSRTSGAWRSTDSEQQFASFQSCLAPGDKLAQFDANDLVLALLAQWQTWHCYTNWLDHEAAQLQARLNTLLAVGRLKLTLQRLYFIGSVLVDCRQGALQQEHKRQLLHAVLRNSPEFSETFSCRHGDALYAQQSCLAI